MGLKAKYKNEETFREFCNSIIALAFVPEHDVVRAINMLKEKAENTLQDEAMDLLTYFETTYVGVIRLAAPDGDHLQPMKKKK